MPSGEPETSELKYKRVLLKLSGEALMGPGQFGIDIPTCEKFAKAIKEAREAGAEVCLVIGGGNIFRGVAGAAKGMDRAQADSMGMLATVMNALAMQSVLENMDVPTRVLSAIHMEAICEPYIRRRAIRHMKKGRVVIFAAGTGNPFFTTDTAASLRAIEIGADVIMKATRVDGVYSADPEKTADAERYTFLTYKQVLNDELGVMDATAISLCMENRMPIIVFDGTRPGNIVRAVMGEDIGTTVAEASA